MPYKDKNLQKEKNRIYQKNHYNKNKKYYSDKAKENKEQVKNFFKEYKETLKCNRCDESHPACFDFHHKDAEQKEIGIARAIAIGWSIRKILEEIEKCEVLCSNCHRILHYEMNNEL